MIITKLQHGLGNQLFQYSVGTSLAFLNRTINKLDISWYASNPIRDYALHNFMIREFMATRHEINTFFCNNAFLKNRNRIIKLYNKLFDFDHFPYSINVTRVVESSSYFDSDILKKGGDIYLEGFWVSYKYIIPEVEARLRNEFQLRFPLSKKAAKFSDFISQCEQPVALHVRRGDYVARSDYVKKFGSLEINYYQLAIEILQQRLGNFQIFAFTDDPDWVQDNFWDTEQLTIVSGNNIPDYEELHLMSKCQHNVIANSTFSWWGAWLNENPQKIVIAPKKWMNNGKFRLEDIIPNDWITI